MAIPVDEFNGQRKQSVIAPSDKWAALTPHDSTNFAFIPKAIHNNTAVAGTFVAEGSDGVTATFYMPAGGVLAIGPRRINSTGLTGGMAFVGLK